MVRRATKERVDEAITTSSAAAIRSYHLRLNALGGRKLPGLIPLLELQQQVPSRSTLEAAEVAYDHVVLPNRKDWDEKQSKHSFLDKSGVDEHPSAMRTGKCQLAQED